MVSLHLGIYISPLLFRHLGLGLKDEYDTIDQNFLIFTCFIPTRFFLSK